MRVRREMPFDADSQALSGQRPALMAVGGTSTRRPFTPVVTRPPKVLGTILPSLPSTGRAETMLAMQVPSLPICGPTPGVLG